MNIVCTHIVSDITNRQPGVVTITYFNSRGEKTREEVIPNNKLFPNDLKVGDELMFCKKEKQSTSINALPSLLPD